MLSEEPTPAFSRLKTPIFGVSVRYRYPPLCRMCEAQGLETAVKGGTSVVGNFSKRSFEDRFYIDLGSC